MALLTYNGSTFDNMLGSASILTTTVSLLTTGITSAGVTAPNTTNKITGCWVCFSTVPSNNVTIAINESGVTKVSAVMNAADIKIGFNYVRFSVPYQFATLTASAYTAKATVATANTGALRNSASGFWFEMTYDTATSLGTTDDLWCGGFHNSGLTPQTYTFTGTSAVFGSGTDTAVTGGTAVTMGAGCTVGNGGTVAMDNTANCTIQMRGSLFVTVGGLFDKRASATKSIVSKLIIDNNTSNGQFGLFVGVTTNGGQILTTAATYDRYTTYASGLGTAASPMITQTGWDAQVGDEIIIGGGTDYSKNERRFIITRNSSTSFVLSGTSGGTELALANTHTAGSYMSNLSSNSIITAQNTTRGWWTNMASTTGVLSAFDYTRMEYTSCVSGNGINISSSQANTYDGIVLYNNATAGRGSILIQSTFAQQHSNIVLFNQQGSNFSGQSGIQLQTCSNKIIDHCFSYNDNATALNCAMVSFTTAAVNNTVQNCHAYGCNAPNSAAGYAIGIFASSGNTISNCSVDATRTNAVYLAGGTGNIFNNCNFGTIATNTVDVQNLTTQLNGAIFNSCSFSSATLIASYTSLLVGSLIGFQNYNNGTTSFKWYTNYGSGWSSGAGLTDTTVRTAGSLALALKPENNSAGFTWSTLIPASGNTNVFVSGYMQRNTNFSSGALTVSLYLPGNVSNVPDATYLFPTTTGSWLPFNISAYYSSSTSGLATVVVNAVTSTAGAYVFLDDFYDAGLNNKLAGDVMALPVVNPDGTFIAGSSGGLSDPRTGYGFSDSATVTNVDYVGYINKDGAWFIMRIEDDHATYFTGDDINDYTEGTGFGAWASALTPYEIFSEAF